MAILPSNYHNEYLQRELRQRLPLKRRAQPDEGGYMGGPTAGQFGMMSQATPTAQDRQAFTNRNIARAQFGRYGRGGLERERIAADTGIKREGLRSAEKVAGIQAGAQTGAEDIRARAARDVAGVQGQTSRDVAGIQSRTQLDVAEKERLLREQELQDRFGPEGVERIRATKPDYQYFPKYDTMSGIPMEYQAFAEGKPVGGQQVNRQEWWNSMTEDERKRYLEEAKRRRQGQ